MNIKLYNALAPLLEYPTAEFAEQLAECWELTRDIAPEIADEFTTFAAGIKPLTLAAMEELYIQTFDFNPKSTLDLGWQLFAEDYNRGLFLAKLRTESRRLDVAETAELPDHLPHVLRLLAKMEKEQAVDFIATCVLPATGKARDALDQASPYRHLVQCVCMLLESLAGPPAEIPFRIPLPLIDELQADPSEEVTRT